MRKQTYEFYGKFFFYGGLTLLAIWILLPFLKTLLATGLLAMGFYPLYRRFNKRYKSWLASLLTVGIVVLCFLIPLFFMLGTLAQEITVLYPNISDMVDSYDSVIKRSNLFLQETLNISFNIEQTISSAIGFVLGALTGVITSFPRHIVNFFIMLFLLYYTLIHAHKVREFIVQLLPFNSKQKKHLVKRFTEIVYGVMFGHIITAIVQGGIAGLGYWVVGVPAPLLWSLITMIAALVPMVGTAIVWLPASLILVFTGLSDGSWGWGVGLFVYGFLVVSNIDSLIRPYLVSGKSHVHPVWVLLGALGGLSVFGITGLFLGPLILAMFIHFIVNFEEHQRIN